MRSLMRRPAEQDDQAYNAYDESLDVEGPYMRSDCRKFVCGVYRGGSFGKGEPQQVFKLSYEQCHGNACGESGGDGVGDEADDGAQLEQTHEHEQHAGDDGGGHQPLESVGRHDAGHDGGEGGSGARYVHAASAEQRNDEAGHDGGVKALLGADA